MGRNRRRNRNRRINQRSQFHANSNRQAFQSEINSDQFDHEQTRHLQNLVDQKKDILSRSVFVGSVLGSLRVKETRDSLKRTMEQKYGPVQKVSTRKGGGIHPVGIVTFNFQRDAERIFGQSLVEASEQRQQLKVHCTIGYKGSIKVWPAQDYKGLMNGDGSDASVVQVNTSGLSVGYWFPSGKDECNNFPGLESLDCAPNTWIPESIDSNINPIMKIDMQNAVVVMDVSHCIRDHTLNFLSMILGEIYGEHRTSISFRFKDLTHPMKLCNSSSGYSLMFELRHPPRLTSLKIDARTGFETSARLTELSELPNLGCCFGYRIDVEEVEINRLISAEAFTKMKKMGLCDDEFDLIQHAEVLHVDRVQPYNVHELNKFIASFPSHRLGFLIRSIVDSNSCTLFDMLNDKMMGQDILGLVKDSDGVLAEKILNEMRQMHGKTRYPAQLFSALYQADEDLNEVALTVPEYCISLPRVLITPLSVRLTGFEVEMSNRIVGKFIEGHKFTNQAFVRVSIGDENTDNLYSNDLSNQVEARIKDLVLNGITIGQRNYVFLAYSSSQLKEQSLWVVCPEKVWDVKRMRASMGDFSMCKTPSKYAARMGQCFSTTIDTSNDSNSSESITHWAASALGFARSRPRVNDALPDIISRTGQEHSDGVGLISREYLDAVLLQIPFGPVDKVDVSAIQIRYGGAKGVLVAWDFSLLKNKGIKGYDVCLRPSQVKFKAPYDNLEVVTIAKRIPYYLNRNVILLGQHHNISERTFLDLQERHIESLNMMLYDASLAMEHLPNLSGPDNALMNILHNMLCSGLEPQRDPFLYSCLHCTRSHHLMNLRKKARVFVEKGAVLIGGIDELGLIPENCCYLQVPNHAMSETNEYEVIKGRVMVTKHPVMHPGDMRMLEAIDIPELHGHKNVVLFSQHGDRPQADKMSGSDLDGDQFAITWDPRLFLATTVEPMDYSPAKKSDENNVINDETLLQHFINHARNDNLGRISMLWIDHATIKKDAGCSECLQLAKLASIAVDFPKSGVPAILPDELLLKPNIPIAHWRERKERPSFKCKSAVGKLYDGVVNEMNSKRNAPQAKCIAMAGRYLDNYGQILYLGDANRINDSKKVIFSMTFARRLGWIGDDFDKELLDFADEQRYLYESQLLELMNQYKIKSEGEVTTGCILKYHKLHKRRRHDISEEVRRQFRSIRKLFRSEFFTAVYHLVFDNQAYLFNDDDDAKQDISDEDLEWIEVASTGAKHDGVLSIDATKREKAKMWSSRLAAACYIATYSPLTHNEDSKSVLFSFPWTVAADVIAYSMNET